MSEVMALDGYIALARLKQAVGDPAGALKTIQRAKSLARDIIMELENKLVDAQQTRLWLRQGNLDAAGRWARDCCAAADRPQQPYMMREIEELTLARVYLAQRRPAEALRLLAALLPSIEMFQRTTALIETLMLQAIGYHLQEDLAQAMAALTRALSLAEREGYVRIFVDEGELMVELLHKAQAAERDEGMKEYIRQLLAALTRGENGKTQARPIRADDEEAFPPSSFNLHLLSDRELDVLRLIAAGKSNQEIARALVVATSTVKKHLDNIYSKLNVHSRTQALARARELGLLQL
jgi:LuxR family maltose regulon positive regulatory protein